MGAAVKSNVAGDPGQGGIDSPRQRLCPGVWRVSLLQLEQALSQSGQRGERGRICAAKRLCDQRLDALVTAGNQVFLRLYAGLSELRVGLVQGDVSPKNILIGPASPILLDAECAWYGDPAFDLAFCLNHLLLKCLVQPPLRAQYLAAFHAFTESYLGAVRWERATAVESRATALLTALLQACVDGKSPVEYVRDDAARNLVRRVGRPLVASAAQRLGDVAHARSQALSAHAERG